jgi:hypothetical protein
MATGKYGGADVPLPVRGARCQTLWEAAEVEAELAAIHRTLAEADARTVRIARELQREAKREAKQRERQRQRARQTTGRGS